MIEKQLKTTTGKLMVKIPDSLNEVTLGQMMALQEQPALNDLEAISILSGTAVQELKNAIDISDFQAFKNGVLLLSHQIKYLYNSDVVPKTITFFTGKDSVKVNVINNLSVEPAGAFMAARDLIADEINEHLRKNAVDNFNPSLKTCCQVLAHYFFCRATGKKYNEYEAEEFCTEIKKLRVTEALPIAKHFFTCYPYLLKPKTSFWHRFRQFWRKGQAFKPLPGLNILTP